MGIQLVVPRNIWGGFYWKSFNSQISLGLFAHTLQCDQRWVFLIRIRKHAFGYRTRGDASPDIMTYYDAGWYWPWKSRFCSGRR